MSRVNALTRPSSSSSLGYDPADRLTSLAHAFTPTTGNETWTLGFTAGGQLGSSASTNAAWDWAPTLASSIATVPDGLNRNASVGGTSWVYDPNGNLTSDGVRSFTYDAENRLLTESGPVAMTLAYDPTGRLQQSIINGATTNFLYDGDALVAEYNGGGTLVRRYVHGPEVDNPLVWFAGATMTSANAKYLIADRQGSIAGVANSSGAITANYAYDSYGVPNTWGTIGSAPRFRYTGQAAIPEAKLYYYKARVYDPTAGKFLQTDPVGDQSDLNLYAYVGEDPINDSDPSGDTDIFIGGASDRRTNLVRNIFDPYAHANPSRHALYFTWTQYKSIVAAIRAAPPGEPINVIAHSFGAPTGLRAVRDSGVAVTNLITIDPVGPWIRSPFENLGKPTNVANWLNVTAKPTHPDESDLVAWAGGKPSALRTSQADSNVSISTHHGDFGGLFGQSGAQSILDQSYQNYNFQVQPFPLNCNLSPGLSCGTGVGAVWGNGGNQR